jgi:hypothetical protein
MGALLSNFASAKLLTPPSGTGGLSFTVATGKGALFESPTGVDYQYLVFAKADKSAFEIVKVEARSGDSFTIETGGRGLDGTTASTWSADDIVYFGLRRRCSMMWTLPRRAQLWRLIPTSSAT